MPFGPPPDRFQSDSWAKRMPYDHDLEVTRPWYYSTYLTDNGVTVEFTPGRFTGYYRFTFPANATPSILLDMFNDGESSWHFDAGSGVTGNADLAGRRQGLYVWGIQCRSPALTGFPDSSHRKSYITFPTGTTSVGLQIFHQLYQPGAG